MWTPLALGLLGAAGWSAGPAMLAPALVMAVLGAGSAAGSLALARRTDDLGLLEAAADIADVGLTEKETHELLA